MSKSGTATPLPAPSSFDLLASLRKLARGAIEELFEAELDEALGAVHPFDPPGPGVAQGRPGRGVAQLSRSSVSRIVKRLRKVLVSLQIAGSESLASWKAVVMDLQRRGMPTPQLVALDGSGGLVRPVKEGWPTADVQRCAKHRLQGHGRGAEDGREEVEEDRVERYLG